MSSITKTTHGGTTCPFTPESGIDRRVLWASIVVSTLVFVASWLPIAIPDFGCAWVAGAATSQPAVLACAKAGHKACQGCHCSRFFLAEVSGEPFVSDAVFESC